MPAPAAILKLCETFAAHREHYRSGNYNEAQLRKQLKAWEPEALLSLIKDTITK